MKKTIIALFALSGVLAAVEQDFSMVRNTEGVSFTLGEAVLTPLKENPLELSYTGWSYSGGGNNSTGWQSPTDADLQNTFSPDGQLRASSNDSWTMNFTLSNNGKENVTLSITELVFKCYGINSGGSNKNAEIQASLTLAGTLGGENYSATSQSGYKLGCNGNTNDAILTFTTPITLKANESINLALTMKNLQTNDWNTYSGITSGVVKYTIPEPATATLSLLALAGLAVRRRRK
ncbi:MAG: PEP-CTERM sorting domain-containing protein [Akkermansia sp.]|nr:PEP-CTERM sorting domain-containing protein [Akkermansia sp.]